MGQVERTKRTTWLQALWIANDLVSILAGFAVGFWIRFDSSLAEWIPPRMEIPSDELYTIASVVAAAIWLPMFFALGFYRVDRGRARHRRGDLLRGLALGFFVLTAVGFFYRGSSFSRVALLLIWGSTSTFVLLGRTLVSRLLLPHIPLRPIRFAVVGDGPLAQRIIESLISSPFPHRFVGVFDTAPSPSAPWPGAAEGGENPNSSGSLWLPRETSPSEQRGSGRTLPVPSEKTAAAVAPESKPSATTSHKVEPKPRANTGSDLRVLEGEGGARLQVPILGTVDEISSAAPQLDLDLVLVAARGNTGPLASQVYRQCQPIDLDFQFVPDVLSLWGRRVRVEDIDGVPLLRLRELPLVGWNGVVKRTLDIVVSAILLVVLSPLFLLLTLAVRFDSPGPILHRQERVGRDRRPFQMLKFRSMREDAEKGTGPIWASSNDPRRTRTGGFLRKWSLDELPQFWNVFRGEMSLVGPRPERPLFVDQFEQKVQDYYDRHRVKSGVTGWAQVHGLRGNVPIEHRTAYDLYYVENWSLWFDLRILWMTLWAVVAHRGE